MKIAIVTATAKEIGGVEAVTHMLKRSLEKKHQVDILSADQCPSTKSTFRKRLIGLPFLTSSHYSQRLKEYDLVLSNGEFGWGINHPNSIVLFHGSYYGISKSLKPYLCTRSQLHLKKDAWIQKRGARRKKVVAVSAFTKELLEEQGISVTQVIPNGVDVERFRPQEEAKKDTYLFIANQYGSIDYYRKGFDILENLIDRGLKIDCVSNVDPGKNIKWIKGITHSDIHKIYPPYKALIFPSRFEANALVPLEAMACGVPVVSAPVGYASEIKACLPECVVDDWNPDSYISSLSRINEDYAAISQRCREFAEQNSHQVFCENWNRFIESQF